MQHPGERFILINPDSLGDSHIPLEIHHREGQISYIKLCLMAIAESRKPINCWLFGKPGAGKTAAALRVVKDIGAETGIKGVYVNCWENPTFFAILECITRELRILGAEKLSTSFKLERLKRNLQNERIVIILDEIDQPSPREINTILYNLSQIPTAGLICVCNSQNKYFNLEERVKSRLNPARIIFNEYSEDELFSILNRRAQEALLPYSYSEDLLKEIAQLAQGDARLAIQTLKNAACLTEKNNETKIKLYHVRKAWNSAKDVGKAYLLKKLTDHHRLLYELIDTNDTMLSGDLWRLYLETCTTKQIKPIAVRTYSEYCNDLVDIGLIQAKRAAIKGKVREFSVLQ